MTEVVVVGCGVVGLGFAVALASRGARVLGVDANARHVDALNAGDAGLDDAELGPALRRALDSNAIAFAQSAPRSTANRVWAVAVPTPIDKKQRLDEQFIEPALNAIAAIAAAGDLVLMRSTVPVGYTRRQAARFAKRGLRFAACPDRSVAGRAFLDQFKVPHVVGGVDEAASRAASAVLETLGTVVIVSSPEAAETLKLFANVWRDARFAIANEMAQFCAASGLAFDEIRAAGQTQFERFDIPRAGPVGGPCLTKDVHLLAQSAQAFGIEVPLLVAARRRNEELLDQLGETIIAELRARPSPRRAAILGLAFKGEPQTRDRRGSAGMVLLQRLRAALPDADIRSWDPADDAAGDNGVAAVTSAALVVLANDHRSLRDPERLRRCARGAVVFDLCGVLERPARADLQIRSFGSGLSHPTGGGCVA